MTPHASRGWWLAVAVISSAAVGCSSDTRPTAPLSTNTSAALAVANTFQHMGDSVVAAQGDSDDAGRFYGAAAVLRRVPVYDTITVLVDSVPMTFNAVALAVDDTGSTACPMPPMDDGHDQAYECPWGAPRMTHTLFAWQPGHPPHIIQLVASSDSGAIGLPQMMHGGPQGDSASRDTTGAVPAVPARLKYFDGAGGIWWGSAGAQQNTVVPNGQPCPTPVDSSAADSAASGSSSHGDREGHGWGNGSHMGSASCQMAAFTFQFNGTVDVPPVAWGRNLASGTHTVSLSATAVPGAYITVGGAFMHR